MDTISIRYGEDVTLPFETSDTTAVTATFYIGKPGEVFVFSKTVSLDLGKGVFEFTNEEMELPLGVYNYQINVTDAEGNVEKYPSPGSSCSSCESDFPEFIIYESLDETEVS